MCKCYRCALSWCRIQRSWQSAVPRYAAPPRKRSSPASMSCRKLISSDLLPVNQTKQLIGPIPASASMQEHQQPWVWNRSHNKLHQPPLSLSYNTGPTVSITHFIIVGSENNFTKNSSFCS